MIMMPIRNSYDQNWLPSLFNDFFENDWNLKRNTTAPAINVIEDENEYTIEVAAPGMTKNDFNVSLTEEDYLTISLEKKDGEDNNKKYLRREFSYSKFQQTLVLPEDVDIEKISAAMANGVLTINLKKKVQEERSNEPRIIEIR